MASLSEQLGTGEQRSKLVDDALHVLDQEVADKSGLTGMAIKGAYKLVQSVRPGFLRQVVEHLVDDFLTALDPIYQEAAAQKRPAGAYVVEQKSRVADALLAVTDAKAKRAESATVRGAYEKLRPIAKKQVEAAAPRLGNLVERHAAPTT
ncbi:MAG TPA: hypothetical protein VER33_17090 [Polyangiaceae bacterium]|nr:hypothetical protein [Polyangiaceae bacterium]